MKKLARREEEIMEMLWEKGPMFVKEMLLLCDEPRPHFNTMSTVVRNLETLGYVGHNAFGSSMLQPSIRYYSKFNEVFIAFILLSKALFTLSKSSGLPSSPFTPK